MRDELPEIPSLAVPGTPVPGTYMVRPALQGKSLMCKQGKLHTYIRPVVEAGKLLALMEFAAHF
jgi:hypothetical protein